MKKRIVLYGATGFVGRGLVGLLVEKGFEVIGVSRKGTGDVNGVSVWKKPDEVDLEDVYGVVNLAGEPVDQRWTEEKKKAFYASRVGVTRDVVKRMGGMEKETRPKVLVNASAVGIYGDRGDEVLEETAKRGEGYLADLCAEWEAAADEAEPLGVRVVKMRIGIVLGRDGAAFKKLLRVFKLGIGGRLGGGRQWMPWIHVEDLRRAMVFCLLEESVSGATNGTAPRPETNADLTKKLAKAVRRPVFFPVPGFVLKLVLGGFGGVLLAGQRAVPEKMQSHGFRFRFEGLEQALEDLI